MHSTDYIIVGSGLAGILFCEILREHNQSFVVFDDSSQQSSTVAGGMYNPVILKRFTPVWRAKEQLDLAIPIYHKLETKLNIKLDHKIPVYRLFASVEEQNNWFAASDKPRLSPFMSTDLIHEQYEGVKAPFGFGEVLNTGRIDTPKLIKSYRKYLETSGTIRYETFDHDQLEVQTDLVKYKDLKAKYIVFAEGYGLKRNPYFSYLPLNGTKGELLIIDAPELHIDFVLKSGAFLIPIKENRYLVGATYKWKDKTNAVTQEAREELLTKVRTFLKSPFTVVDQLAGIRPTVADRRPLVGAHRTHKHVLVLNGLGTRGVMIAPYVAKQLYEYIEHGKPLEQAIDINRFN